MYMCVYVNIYIFFRRVRLRDFLIDLVIGQLRSDEISNQTLAFPHPEHRSTVVATQASVWS